jgi:hypothetical protein
VAAVMGFLVDAGFMCSEAAMIGEMIKETPSAFLISQFISHL